MAGVTNSSRLPGFSVLNPEKSQANQNMLVTFTKPHLEDQCMVIKMRKWFSLGWGGDGSVELLAQLPSGYNLTPLRLPLGIGPQSLAFWGLGPQNLLMLFLSKKQKN